MSTSSDEQRAADEADTEDFVGLVEAYDGDVTLLSQGKGVAAARVLVAALRGAESEGWGALPYAERAQAEAEDALTALHRFVGEYLASQLAGE